MSLSAIPTCMSSNNPTLVTVCRWKEAHLVSASFAEGLMSGGNDFERWDITGPASCYIALTIIDFDVGCESKTIFETTNDAYHRVFTTRFCNRNKPVDAVISIQDVLSVNYYLDLNMIPEGFSAKYETIRKNAYIADLPVWNELGEILLFISGIFC